MTEHEHYQRFKRKHKHGMAVVEAFAKPHEQNGHGSKRKMQDSLHLPEQLPLGMRVRMWFQRSSITQGWERVVVNNKVDSITMPKWIASSILGAVLLFGASSWWRASDQRDMLIELRTELKMAKEYDAERAKQIKDQADMNKVYIDNMTNQLNIIRGMLSQQQLSVVSGKGTN